MCDTVTKAQHTHGPWRVGKAFQPDGRGHNPVTPIYADDKDCGECGRKGGQWLVAWTFKNATKNNKADARLIALAPEMFDVVRTIVAICDSGDTNLAQLACMENSPLVDQCRELIAKAEGSL